MALLSAIIGNYVLIPINILMVFSKEKKTCFYIRTTRKSILTLRSAAEQWNYCKTANRLRRRCDLRDRWCLREIGLDAFTRRITIVLRGRAEHVVYNTLHREECFSNNSFQSFSVENLDVLTRSETFARAARGAYRTTAVFVIVSRRICSPNDSRRRYPSLGDRRLRTKRTRPSCCSRSRWLGEDDVRVETRVPRAGVLRRDDDNGTWSAVAEITKPVYVRRERFFETHGAARRGVYPSRVRVRATDKSTADRRRIRFSRGDTTHVVDY